MDLSVLLDCFNMALTLDWKCREGNVEAVALTDEDFTLLRSWRQRGIWVTG